MNAHLDELRAETRGFVFGGGQQPWMVDRLLEIIHEGDVAGDGRLGFEARMAFLNVCGRTDTERPHEELAALLSATAYADEHPEHVDAQFGFWLLWEVKGIVEDMTRDPRFSLDQLEAVTSDYGRRLQAAGYSRNAEYGVRLQIALDLADADGVRRNLPLLLRAPRDRMSDCSGCQIDHVMTAAMLTGDVELAVREGEQMLAGTNAPCSLQPFTTQAQLLVPLTMLGRIDDAVALYARVRRRISGGTTHASPARLALCEWLARIGQVRPALDLAAAWPTPTAEASPYDQLRTVTWQAYALSRAVDAGRGDAPFIFGDATTVAAAADLAESFVRDLAARFDERNGTTNISTQVAADLEAPPLAENVRITRR